MALTKETARREFLKRRVRLEEGLRRKKDRKITENLFCLRELREARLILFYYPLRGEPDITPLMRVFMKKGGQVALPKVEGEHLGLYLVSSLSSLKKGSFGVLEPTEGVRVEPEDLDLALVPGILFDRAGYRIGFGKGYYDRLLNRIKALKVGVAYAFQVLESVPRDPWDRPVDVVVTEKEVIRRL